MFSPSCYCNEELEDSIKCYNDFDGEAQALCVDSKTRLVEVVIGAAFTLYYSGSAKKIHHRKILTKRNQSADVVMNLFCDVYSAKHSE